MAEEIKKDMEPELTLNIVVEFLEYEEAMTKDKDTASRIRTFLKLMGIWN